MSGRDVGGAVVLASPRLASVARPTPRVERREVRLLVVDPVARRLELDRFVGLARWLVAGDLLVVNDAATLPASLVGRSGGGRVLEARLVGPPDGDRAWVVLLGAGDHRTRTEDRPAPPGVAVGERLCFARAGDRHELGARVVAVSPRSPRLVELAFEVGASGEDGLWAALYALGRPVQYAHRPERLALWDVQTAYASRPWAVEMPSAGRPLTWDVLAPLAARGVRVAALTHAAGLSSTGDAGLDAALPLPERYEIPASTASLVHETRARGGRVIAVGTSVVRALESAAEDGEGGGRGVATSAGVRPGRGVATLVLDSGSRRRVVDGLVSGVHGPGESHFRLLAAFLDPSLLEAMWGHAVAADLATHELGDATLVLPHAFRDATRN